MGSFATLCDHPRQYPGDEEDSGPGDAPYNLYEDISGKNLVPSNFKADALHIAVATLWKADALVSYNFEHIVNLEVMVAVNELNRSLNLNEIFLCQPQEVIISDL